MPILFAGMSLCFLGEKDKVLGLIFYLRATFSSVDKIHTPQFGFGIVFNLRCEFSNLDKVPEFAHLISDNTDGNGHDWKFQFFARA